MSALNKSPYKIYYNKFTKELKNASLEDVKRFLDNIKDKYFIGLYDNIVSTKDMVNFKKLIDFSNNRLSLENIAHGLWYVSFDLNKDKRLKNFKSVLNIYKKCGIEINHNKSIENSLKSSPSPELLDFYFTKFPVAINNTNVKEMLYYYAVSDNVNMIDWLFNHDKFKITKRQKVYTLKASMIKNKEKLVCNYIIETEFSKPVGKSILIDDALLKDVRVYRNHPEYEILESRKMQQELLKIPTAETIKPKKIKI